VIDGEGIDKIYRLIEQDRLRALRNGFRVACMVLGKQLDDANKASDLDTPDDVLAIIEEFMENYGLMQHEQLEAFIADHVKNSKNDSD
jgi:hypothetical protein